MTLTSKFIDGVPTIISFDGPCGQENCAYSVGNMTCDECMDNPENEWMWYSDISPEEAVLYCG